MQQRVTPSFHAFTIKYDRVVDRIITQIKISQCFDFAQPPNPPLSQYETNALWDTGATKSVITKATADALGLTPVGNIMVNHAGGSSISNRYIVNFILPNGVGAQGALVTESPDIVGNFGAIIGMDIIALGDLSITNVNGKTCMSFRTPAIAQIDYVLEANRIKFRGAKRNEPCPCGRVDSNGKPVKFKHCHEPELTNA